MGRTFAKAEMTFADVTAIESAEVTLTTAQPLSSPVLFSEKSATVQPDYGTLELNQFVLDGEKAILPDLPTDIAFWSEEKSGHDGTFLNPPKFIAEFDGNHTSAGLTFFFGNDYPAEVLVTYYDIDGAKIESMTFRPDALTYIAFGYVENYAKVEIEFRKTRLPYSFIQLRYIMYGFQILWEDGQIQKADIHEEIDETSATIPINTARIEIVDERSEFDVANNNGLWKALQKSQPLTLTEYQDGDIVPMGTFFIDGHSFSNNIASFSLVDQIGVMDSYQYRNGQIYTGQSAGAILRDIFAAANVEKYDIDSKIDAILLQGTLGIMSCREALQMVCFACNAVADCSRSDTIKVFFPDRYVSHNIRTNRKLNGCTTVSKDEYVSGISITCSSYALQTESTELCRAMLSVGDNTIEFSNPIKPESIETNVGTVITAKTNYCIIRMTSDEECIITGQQYETTEFTIVKNVQNLEANEVPNIKEFSGITLYNPSTLWEICDWLLKFYALRKTVSMQYLAETEKVGDWVQITDINRNNSYTLIESQDINLSGGFIASARCRGYSIVVTDFDFTGEIYAGGMGVL